MLSSLLRRGGRELRTHKKGGPSMSSATQPGGKLKFLVMGFLPNGSVVFERPRDERVEPFQDPFGVAQTAVNQDD